MKTSTPSTDKTLLLNNGWNIQSSASVKQGGGEISSADFKPAGWLTASIPAGAVSAQVENKVFDDPNFGMNLQKYPGMAYPIGDNFSLLDMPGDSPYA